MINFYINSSLYIQVLIATFMTFFITALGAAIVFVFKKVNSTLLDAMMGASAGVMIAASFWSLLEPAINEAEYLKQLPWLVCSLGFISGGVFLLITDFLFDKYLNKKRINNSDSLKRSWMLIFSITMHNIPEGLAIGVAFGSLASNSGNTLLGAFMLAVGVGIQNFPEGCAVSLPLRRENFSRTKSFVLGALSGIVEPISGLIGCILVMYIQSILPFLLSFAAGAMIYVAVSELIPESQKNIHKNIMTLFTLLGFAIMMILDVALS